MKTYKYIEFHIEYPMSQKVALYIRTSTDKQQESLVLQNDELRKYCSVYDYEIVEVYKDSGWSGKNASRPAFEKMLSDALIGKFEIVLCTKIDRFARSVLDCLRCLETLKESNVDFITTSQPIKTNDAVGVLTLQIMAAFAEFERSIISERMNAGRRAAEARGKKCHRERIDIKKKEVVDYLNKRLSANDIAKLMEVDVTTITSRLKEWKYEYIEGKWISRGV